MQLKRVKDMVTESMPYRIVEAWYDRQNEHVQAAVKVGLFIGLVWFLFA